MSDVDGPEQARLLDNVGYQLSLIKGMIAERQAVNSAGEQQRRMCERYPSALGRVFGVDSHEVQSKAEG